MLEFLALGHRLFLGGLFLDILEPFAKGVNLHAVADQFLAAHLGVEQVQLLDRSDDFRDGGIVVPIGEKFCPDGANLHHDRLRAELLEALADIILRGEVLHEVEQLKDVLGVALDGLEVLKLEVANAAVMILDGLLLELGALVGVDAEAVVLAAVFFAKLLKAVHKVVKQCGVSERPLAVGATLRVHLQQTEVDSQLQLVRTILALDPACVHAAKAVVPVLEDFCDVVNHPGGSVPKTGAKSMPANHLARTETASEPRSVASTVPGWMPFLANQPWLTSSAYCTRAERDSTGWVLLGCRS